MTYAKTTKESTLEQTKIDLTKPLSRVYSKTIVLSTKNLRIVLKEVAFLGMISLNFPTRAGNPLNGILNLELAPGFVSSNRRNNLK